MVDTNIARFRGNGSMFSRKDLDDVEGRHTNVKDARERGGNLDGARHA